MISRAVHLNVFDQPVKKYFFNNLTVIDRAFEKQKARVLTSPL